MELWAQRKDGRRVSVDIALSPVQTDDGPLVLAIVQDITERRLAEESMREAYERERTAADNLRALDETKTVFLEAVSHELRTPLTVIVGISSLLQDDGLQSSDPGYPELVSSLDTSARRLEHLLDDLLDLDRLGRGIVKPHRRPTAVAELAARVVGGLDIGRHPVHVDAHEVVADIDPAQTERIIENLVANALKHTPPETPIWVRAESAEDGVVVVVEDAGPGVPDNIRDTVFAPFVKDTRGHIPGTGIGLSLVLRFAALHGGRAWVTDRPGGGACFNVYLPSTEEGPPSEEVA
jgi:signal transduction histidine kinase